MLCVCFLAWSMMMVPVEKLTDGVIGPLNWSVMS